MVIEGNLRKMVTALKEGEVQYNLRLRNESETQLLPLNDYLGHSIEIAFLGKIHCVVCGRKTNKSFSQGFCYPCFRDAPENSECIIHPERCQGHLGGGRDPEWEAVHHVKPHIVYLSQTSGIKVGVTRNDQIPTRWIDQGAIQACVIARTPYRQLAGAIEVALKAHFKDKTSWQAMLKGKHEAVEILPFRDEAHSALPSEFQEYLVQEDSVPLNFPMLDFPTKVQSTKLDKAPLISGTLTGIKAQYLLLDNYKVINLRNHSGYLVRISLS